MLNITEIATKNGWERFAIASLDSLGLIELAQSAVAGGNKEKILHAIDEVYRMQRDFLLPHYIACHKSISQAAAERINQELTKEWEEDKIKYICSSKKSA